MTVHKHVNKTCSHAEQAAAEAGSEVTGPYVQGSSNQISVTARQVGNGISHQVRLQSGVFCSRRTLHPLI